MITEELLQFLWKYKLYASQVLKTTQGEPIEVIHPGIHNTDSGPDFFNAKIKIGDTLWAGNVEVHVKSSDWFLHQHHTNKAYNNVILHVVIDSDRDACSENGRLLPVLVLKVQETLLSRYKGLMRKQKWLFCSENDHPLMGIEQLGWLDGLMADRLEERCDKIFDLLDHYNGDWDQVFFILVARGFGFGINGDAFEVMARHTPVKRLLQHADSLFQVEAFLFGQAGFLNVSVGDSYQDKLAAEYRFLKNKYDLKGIEQENWKFLRLRPNNFPTIRLAQLSMFVHQNKGLNEAEFKFRDIGAIRQLFAVSVGSEWQKRYHFGAFEKISEKHLGFNSQNLLLINAVIPLMFAYGKRRGDSKLQERALQFFDELPPERNHIVRDWQLHLGIMANNAAHSQALVYQYNSYCVPRKCLQCKVGLNYLQSAVY